MRAIPLITVLFAVAYFVGLVYEHDIYAHQTDSVVGSVFTPVQDINITVLPQG